MLDKKTVKVGDVVNVSIKASDEGSGIKWIYFSYEAPQTGNKKEITMTYDADADVYRGQIRMEDMPSEHGNQILCLSTIRQVMSQIFIVEMLASLKRLDLSYQALHCRYYKADTRESYVG